jgi:hypothetical protein
MYRMRIIVFAIVLFSINVSAQKLDVIAGYFPYWKAIEKTNFSHYNYLYYAFIYPTSSGGLQFLNSDTTDFLNFKNTVASLSSKKLISIGSDGMKEMVKNPTARLYFADTLRKFCKTHQFSGIDVDWEGIDNATDRTNYTALLKDLRNTIDSTDLELVITVGFGNYWMQWYDDIALQQADFLQLMIYDQTGTWASSPFGNHASLDHIKQAETYWLRRGFARNKLVLGLPYYGYRFSSTSGGLATPVSYADILTQFPDMKSSDNYLSNSSGYYWFNGVDLIKEKVNYAINNGFKGVFVWELTQDNYSSPLSLDLAMNSITKFTTSIDDISIASDIKITIFPNPCRDLLVIKGFDAKFQKGSLRLYSCTGQLVFENNINVDEMIFKVDNLLSGLHIVRVTSADNSITEQYKVIVE